MSYEHYEKEVLPCVNFEKCKQMVDRVKREFEKPRVVLCEGCRMEKVREYTRLRIAAMNKMLPLKKFHRAMAKYKKPDEPMHIAYKRFLGEKV